MLPSNLEGKVKEALGDAFNTQTRYVITTPAGVPSRLRRGCRYLVELKGNNGEDLVVMEAEEDVHR